MVSKEMVTRILARLDEIDSEVAEERAIIDALRSYADDHDRTVRNLAAEAASLMAHLEEE